MPTATAKTITDSQIRTLRDEAATEAAPKETPTMTTKTATVTHAAHTFTATVIDGRVTIAQDGVWAGEGRYNSHGIEDCPAVLGDEEDSEEIYRLLDAALAATIA